MSTEPKMGSSHGVNRFEDLIAWQKARSRTHNIYQITSKGSFARDYGLAGQIQRASVSIMANLSKGFERGTIKDFLRFVVDAKSSCAEVRSHLYVALDVGYLNQRDFHETHLRAQEVSRIIGGLRVILRNKLSEQSK